MASKLMHQSRRGFFRHVYAFRGDTGGCAGQAPLWDFFFKINFGVNTIQEFANSCGTVFTHELGHSVGLEHGGHLKWSLTNSKPNYQSIMNYSFFTKTGFTSSLTAQQKDLNPQDLDESEGLGFGIDPTLLAESPFFLPTEPFSLNSWIGVYWSRGEPALHAKIRHPVTLSKTSGYGFENLQLVDSQPVNEHGSGVKLLYVHPQGVLYQRLYLFYLKPKVYGGISKGRIFYRRAIVHPVPNNNSSCPGGDKLARRDPLTFAFLQADTCVTWLSEIEVFAGGENESEPQSIKDIKFFNAIYFEKTNTKLIDKFFIADVDNSQVVRTYMSDDVLQNGTIFWSSSDPLQLSIPGTGTPEFVLSGASGGEPTNLKLFYRRSNLFHLWLDLDFSSSDPADWSWQNLSYVLRQGSPFQGTIAPTLMWWPKVGQPGELCGLFTLLDNQMRFLCNVEGTDVWNEYTTKAFGETPLYTVAKPSLVYRFERSPNGTTFDNISQALGKYWLIYFSPIPEHGGRPAPFTRMSRMLNATHSPTSYSLTEPIFSVDKDFPFGGVYQGTSDFSLLEDTRLAGLMAAGTRWRPDQSNLETTFFPFADATYNAELKTGSDFQVMSRGICLGLKRTVTVMPEFFCGTIADNLWEY
jgi:hypothetical protein